MVYLLFGIIILSDSMVLFIYFERGTHTRIICIILPYRFSESLDGVLLAYDVDIVGSLGKILSGIHPYFGVKLTSKLLLFNPKPDMLLGNLCKPFKLTFMTCVQVFQYAYSYLIFYDVQKERWLNLVNRQFMSLFLVFHLPS